MNRPPEDFVVVEEERLLEFSTACFQKAGLDADHAALITRLLVNSDLRGVRTHGTAAMNGYCECFEKRTQNPHPNIAILSETPTTAVVDGDGTLGYLPMVKATELAITKAKELGLGMGIARNIGHYGSAGHYARMCMEEGCVGFSVQGYYELGKYHDRNPKPQIGYFGNPPICFAIPGNDGPPVILDAATRILADYQTGPEFDRLLDFIPAAFFKSMGYTAVAGLLARGETVGVFQLESEGMRRTLAAVRPTGFEDIIALVSLYRPGPMDNIPMFGRRKNGEETIEYPHPLLEPILKETYGIIVYQEQVMRIANVLAGYNMAEADVLRKAMGKKIAKLIREELAQFIDKSVERGVDKRVAQNLAEQIGDDHVVVHDQDAALPLVFIIERRALPGTPKSRHESILQ